uniref:Cytidine deaminase n=1 Tax=Caenorhabditis tropicalis TaxID=1561998 RepID=A0A1I7V0K3_9PELO
MAQSLPQDISDVELVNLAKTAMKRAHCPYSKFPVGAALLTESGETILGCNVENASYGGTICAERSAVVSAVSQGHTKFRAISVVTELKEPAAPCGLCRQFLVEFGNFKVILGSAGNNKLQVTSSHNLLPFAFTPDSLDTFEQEKSSDVTDNSNERATVHS